MNDGSKTFNSKTFFSDFIFEKSEKELLSIQHKRQSDILCLSILDRYWTLKCFQSAFLKFSRISNVVAVFFFFKCFCVFFDKDYKNFDKKIVSHVSQKIV